MRTLCYKRKPSRISLSSYWYASNSLQQKLMCLTVFPRMFCKLLVLFIMNVEIVTPPCFKCFANVLYLQPEILCSTCDSIHSNGHILTTDIFEAGMATLVFTCWRVIRGNGERGSKNWQWCIIVNAQHVGICTVWMWLKVTSVKNLECGCRESESHSQLMKYLV